jgi:hypothetical protein
MERLARAARMNAATAVEAEQRIRGAGAAAFDLAGEEYPDARPVRNQTALAELATPHRQEPPLGVDVADAQATRLP